MTRKAATTAADPLRARTGAVISRLARLLPQAARHPQPDVVHRLRTHIRRAEALLGVHPPAQTDPKLCKQLQKLRRRAGRVRDLDVHLGLLRGVHVEGDQGRKQALLQAMEPRREREAARLQGKLDPAARRELVRR
ncbi:MAG: CHAD domain-containing protein, partial [Terriglobales bacterium]